MVFKFYRSFEEVSKKVTIFNGRSVADELNKIKDTLAKTSNDWKVRIEALQMMRALYFIQIMEFR